MLCAIAAHATYYTGRVIDEKGLPVSYATVYPEQKPELGTATNNDGCFSFEADLSPDSRIIISFIGYEKQFIQAQTLLSDPSHVCKEGQAIVLKEQPIALEEAVVAAKPSKQRNKRKQLVYLLHAVYSKMTEEFPDQPAQYQVVSDVTMQSNEQTWEMEQMIANIVVLPQASKNGKDSVQFQGQYCKRFVDAKKRAEADAILAGETLEHLDRDTKTPKGTPEHLMRRAANSIDSGVVVHRTLFERGNIYKDLEEDITDLKHWTVSNESEGETVLTHTRSVIKYMGCLRIVFKRHYIVDSRTYAVRRFSEHADVHVTIPFGYKLNEDQIKLFNLLNMSEKQLERFRLRKLRASVDLNTIYQRVDGKVYLLEKNMILNAHFTGTKRTEIPVLFKATQRVTGLQTKDVKPLTKKQITRRLERQNVEIY